MVIILGYAACQQAFAAPLAISQPSSISAERADAYKGVIESGDVLFVLKFDIVYTNCNTSVTTGCPTDSITDAYLMNVIDDDEGTPCDLSTDHFRSVAPTESTAAGFNGYNAGIAAVYLTAAEVSNGTPDDIRVDEACHALEIEGNPALFGLPPSDEIAVSWQTSAVVTAALRIRAGELEDNWNIDMIVSGGKKLTTIGADYFEAAIPNLRIIAPDLFDDNIINPEPNLSDFTNQMTYRDALLNFWDSDNDPATESTGASFEAQFALLETTYNIPELLWKTAIALIITGAAIYAVAQSTGRMDVGLLAFPVAFPIMILMGMGALEVIAIIAFMATLWLSYVIFLKGA